MTLAVPLLEVEQQVLLRLAGDHAVAVDQAPVFERARRFLLGSVGLLGEVKATLLTDPMGEQKLLLAEQELDHSLLCLERLETACAGGHPMLLTDRLRTFLASAQKCSELFTEFASLGSRLPIYSPSPPFDAFIKAGIKHLEGGLDRSALEGRLLELGRELSRFQRLVALLPRLHPVPAAVVSRLEKALAELGSGFGALEQWRLRDDKVALQDGLKLIGNSTSGLVLLLDELEPELARQPRYSRFRPLEEWLRLRQYLTSDPAARASLPSAWIEAAVVDLFRAWDFLLARAQELDRSYRDEAGQLDFAPCLAARQSWHARLGDRPPADWTAFPESDWLVLAAPLEQLQSAVEQRHQRGEQLLQPFRDLPGLEALAQLKERARSGEVSPALFEAELRRQLARVEELIESSAQARDPISAEFRELLPVHRSGFLGMLECLKRGDWPALESLWQGVMTTLPHLIALSQGIARRMALQSQASLRIACLRCEHSNGPERRVCSNCGANLPAVVARAQSVAELGHGDSGGSQPESTEGMSALDLLEELVRGVEANRVTRQQTGAAIEALLADLEKVRKTFSTKVIPLMGQDPTVDLYLRFFAQAIGAYSGTLKNMQSFAQGASLAQLHSHLAECREMLILLEELKARIDESLRG